MARKVDDAPPMPEGYVDEGHPQADGRAAARNEQFDKWMEDFADKRAVGDRDADFGILG